MLGCDSHTACSFSIFVQGEFPPSNLPLAATGAALLWIGWFGFNGQLGKDAFSWKLVSCRVALA